MKCGNISSIAVVVLIRQKYPKFLEQFMIFAHQNRRKCGIIVFIGF
jgi:hypothetical protein